MNVAVGEVPPTVSAGSASGRERGSATHQADWIDPEGDDWLASIYRELTGAEPNIPPINRDSPELEHWFG